MSASEGHCGDYFVDPRLSSEYVVSLAKDVTIDDEGVQRLALMVSQLTLDCKIIITMIANLNTLLRNKIYLKSCDQGLDFALVWKGVCISF